MVVNLIINILISILPIINNIFFLFLLFLLFSIPINSSTLTFNNFESVGYIVTSGNALSFSHLDIACLDTYNRLAKSV